MKKKPIKIPKYVLKCSTANHKNHFKEHIVAYDTEIYMLERKILASLRGMVFLSSSLK